MVPAQAPVRLWSVLGQELGFALGEMGLVPVRVFSSLDQELGQAQAMVL